MLLPFGSTLRSAISISNYMKFKVKVNLAKLPMCVCPVHSGVCGGTFVWKF